MIPSTLQLAWARRVDGHLSLDGPGAVRFLGEFGFATRNSNAVVALRIGPQAFQPASGAVHVEAGRKNGKRLTINLNTALTADGRELDLSDLLSREAQRPRVRAQILHAPHTTNVSRSAGRGG